MVTTESVNSASLPNPDGEKRGRVNEGLEPDEDWNGGNITNISSTVEPPAVSSPVTPEDHGAAVPWWGANNTLQLLAFTGITVAYMIRVSLSIAIVAMVGHNNTDTANERDTCPLPDDAADASGVEGEFDWAENIQGVILGAFYYGYTVTNFAGGRGAEYWGARLVFGLGIVVSSALTLLAPVCAKASTGLFIALRVLVGMTQGVVFPAIHLMMASWVPPKDKARYSSVVFLGIHVGTVLAMALGGWLCNTNFLEGWPSVFYIFGTIGVVWGIPWFLLAHDLPEHHPSISVPELKYIQRHRYYVKREKAVPMPWREIATSRPFWAITAASFAYNYGFYTLLTELPTYFNNILHFDVSSNGVMSALPYVCQGAMCVLWGFSVDILHAKGYISIKTTRKLSTFIALYVSAACLVGMIWVNCDATLAMAVMCLGVGVVGSINSGSSLSEQDIAPNLAGSLKGITNTVGSATGFLAPAVTGAIINNNQTLSAWNTVFIISAVLNVIFCTIYVIFGTDKIQPWNEPSTKR